MTFIACKYRQAVYYPSLLGFMKRCVLNCEVHINIVQNGYMHTKRALHTNTAV